MTAAASPVYHYGKVVPGSDMHFLRAYADGDYVIAQWDSQSFDRDDSASLQGVVNMSNVAEICYSCPREDCALLASFQSGKTEQNLSALWEKKRGSLTEDPFHYHLGTATQMKGLPR